MAETGVATVRPMTAADISGIVEIDRSIIGRDRSPSWPQTVTRYLEMYFPPLCFVAEVEGKMVGFILGDVRGWEYAMPPSGWVDIIGVHSAHQGKGIGRMLATAFVQECRRRGMKTHIMVRTTDRRVRQFFASLGFHRGEMTELEC